MNITLCGSIGFYTKMVSIRDELMAHNHKVRIPEIAKEIPAKYGSGKKIYFDQYIEYNGGLEAFPAKHAIWNLKESAIKDHFKKIDWCDGILVVNQTKKGIQGYIGGNTLIEIGVAFYLKKLIYILNPISSELSYKQEILGMKPIILEGNISLI